MSDSKQGAFAKTIMEQKYSHTKPDGQKESWPEISKRVARKVMKATNASQKLVNDIASIIESKKFMPGGRYLASAGNQYHQTQNCALFRAEDSREGWADLMAKATTALMTGAGIGVVYSDVRAEGKLIRKTGGTSTGPLALMQMVNEAGRGIMQGGSRRSAIWAGLHWSHPDVFKFIQMKDWSANVRAMKEADYNFPATMDGTNISVILDDEFFEAFKNSKHANHSLAQNVYWATVKQMLKTAEPGFSVDVGVNKGENLRNAPISADTWVMTNTGYRQVGSMIEEPVVVWTGKQWASTVFKKTKENVPTVRVTMSGGRTIIADPEHEFLVEEWEGLGNRSRLVNINRVPACKLEEGSILHSVLPENTSKTQFHTEGYVLGYTYGDGSFTKKYDNRAEITFCTNESKACAKAMSGSELIKSVTETDSRGYTRMYLKGDVLRGRNKIDFPILTSDPSYISSFLAGLFDSDGSYDKKQHRVRLSSVHFEFLEGARRALEFLGIRSSIGKGGISTFGQKEGWLLAVSGDCVTRFRDIIPTVRLKPEAHVAYRDSTVKVISVDSFDRQDVYCCDVGVEEHSFMAEGVIISNCCEITSRDDSDICNLGSINMANIDSIEEMERVVKLATSFLLAGTVYSDVPFPKIDQVRTKNRRLGLGLMGLHEWLLKRGKKYGPDTELEEYLKVYAKSTEFAKEAAKKLELSAPVKTRAIAPTGTIGIVAETTTGIEPIFCVAYKRRYLKGTVVNYQYVIDPCAQRLIESGVSPELIEDAYSLAENVERRVEFQHWLQKYVDHAISSTINLPSWGSELNNDSKVQDFGVMLMKYLPELRGITCYPDGARGGQPLTPVKYSTAIKHVGEIFVEQADICDLTKGGSCGV